MKVTASLWHGKRNFYCFFPHRLSNLNKKTIDNFQNVQQCEIKAHLQIIYGLPFFTWISNLQLLNMERNSLHEVKNSNAELLLLGTNHYHLQTTSPNLRKLNFLQAQQRVEHKSESRCFAFLISACEITAKQRSWSSCKSKATKAPPWQGAVTAHSSTKRLCSKLPLRTWWITSKGIK